MSKMATDVKKAKDFIEVLERLVRLVDATPPSTTQQLLQQLLHQQVFPSLNKCCKQVCHSDTIAMESSLQLKYTEYTAINLR